jgi:hypothetical protein
MGDFAVRGVEKPTPERAYENSCLIPSKFFQEVVDSPCQHDKFTACITEAALCGGTRVANSVMLV